MNKNLKHTEAKTQICIVGGGITGICAAVSAARNGAKVVLIQDRPVLGGNASSEIRMSIGGSQNKDYKESGLMEEIFLRNAHMNPSCNYSLWDVVLYDMVISEPNITLYLNTTCNDAKTDNDRLISVDCWQMQSQSWLTVSADIFIDCSGDSILAPLSGALYSHGREGKDLYNEKAAPEKPDLKTMGNSLLLQLIMTDKPHPFSSPSWAMKFEKDAPTLKYPTRYHDFKDGFTTNFWWLEHGGQSNTIDDADVTRHELLQLALGVYDHIKNKDEHHADNLTLSWLGQLPGKRESRRYVGKHILIENEMEVETPYPDTVAYGGWTADDHDPRGFFNDGEGNTCYPVLQNYAIPYRCLYSKNIENLMFGGRNISVSHSALTSTRVSATCAVIGQAVGTAAAVAVKYGLSPDGVYETKIKELQRLLQKQDAYLPNVPPYIPENTARARISGSGDGVERLVNGINRKLGTETNRWDAKAFDSVKFEYDAPVRIDSIRLYFDSDFSRKSSTDKPHLANSTMTIPSPHIDPDVKTPSTLPKGFIIEGFTGGVKTVLADISDNYLRYVEIPVKGSFDSIVFRITETYTDDGCGVFGIEID